MEILSPKGEVDKQLEPEIAKETLIKIYKSMCLSRAFDEKVIALQRSGRVATLAENKGQEAIVGVVAALSDTDWFIPSYRENAALFYRNVPPASIMAYWGGKEAGNVFPQKSYAFHFTLSLATQLPVAAGMAYAAQLKNDGKVIVVCIGEGASSEGDFHEALNFASIYKVPLVCILANNQYALSTSTAKQTGSKTFAQKAIAYGMKGLRIDGNDVLSFYVAVQQAAQKAKHEGPQFIEALTYRVAMHTTADDHTRYQKSEEYAMWLNERDPIKRFEVYLKQKNVDAAQLVVIQDQATKEIQEAAEQATAQAQADPRDMFEHLFAELPEELKKQREEF